MKVIRKLPVLCWTFFYISAITVGGGMAMIPIMQQAFVDKHKWLTESEMVEIVALTHSLPGVIAINVAVLVGYKVCGTVGAIAAAISAVAAPFAAIVLLAMGRSMFMASPALDHAFLGIRAAVTALILFSAIKLAKGILTDASAWVFASVCFIACAFFGVDVTFAILFGVAAGIVKLTFEAVRRM